MSSVVPLGPESVAWRIFSDWRGMLISLWAGSMQNMHPGLGAGVEQHSRFFEERWERLFRSLYPIAGVVYDGERAAETARRVRDFHRGIGGTDARGRRYHALEAGTFFWAHATFVLTPVLVCEYFGTPLTAAQKERYYAESVRWWRLYGMGMRPVPADWAAFEAYYDRMCREVLEVTPAARAVLDVSDLARPPALARVPGPLWRAVAGPAGRGMVWLTTGLYHPAVRERLGLSWSARDERLLRLLGRAVAAGWRLVPFEYRFHPRARAAWRRARGRGRSGAPLVEAPARYRGGDGARGYASEG
ncbi:oxygenase MpaB family protein [Streptomyces sp. DSM 44917]|uniref:Oxygenase MpaB family protein n=1 Tax=Streptomyces boetiae TaxID=3075541 RepID=A0ABU2LCN7_9ACTN|nr:oxygenase MpaB family protein [Streptomyces sp. DSM 44917]MDT0309339.1 oxygenase MpaB family protein [Streptomyces sp. DSM 44917]